MKTTLKSSFIKKALFLLLLTQTMILADKAWAQDSLIPYHHIGYGLIQPENLCCQRNGEFVTKTLVASPNADTIYGSVFHKVSRSPMAFIDSLLVSDGIGYFYLVERNPLGDDNLRIHVENREDSVAYLVISHFTDDNLAGNPDEDIVVPLYDGYAVDYIENMIDSRNDLILTYYTITDEGLLGHLTRYGLDGTLKHEATFPQYLNYTSGIYEFSSSPLMYYKYKKNEANNLMLYILDEDFQVVNSHVFQNEYVPVVENFFFRPGPYAGSDHVLPDDDDIVVATTYHKSPLAPVYDSLGNIYGYYQLPYDSTENGVAIARFDLRTSQLEKCVKFNEVHGPYSAPFCFGFERVPDGGFLYVFKEGDLYVALKLDADLNLLWKRYCKLSNLDQGVPNFSAATTLFDDGEGEKGMAIYGYSRSTNPNANDIGLFFLFVYDDGTVSVPEAESIVRPYAFYPNPAQDQLRLQYSPDVQPKQIELYDLQGRLVRSQYETFEILNLQGLTPGQYVMKVTLTDGQVFTDKVVKE